jgi:hypothetical protein
MKFAKKIEDFMFLYSAQIINIIDRVRSFIKLYSLEYFENQLFFFIL